jgi:rhamnosyltransferase
MEISNELNYRQYPAICGIVVTYYPDPVVCGHVQAVLQQIDQVVVVDNGTQGTQAKQIETLAQMDHVVVLKNRRNEGIAAALNRGVRWAAAHGYAWVMTLDQDSRVRPTMIRDLWEAYDAFSDRDRVALIAPQYDDPMLQTHISFAQSRSFRKYSPVRVTMTSGNLVKTEVFAKVGWYNEDLFIDLVDFEFCLRCHRLGYVILEATGAQLEHHLGEPSWHYFLGKRVPVVNYSSLRRYYSSRNRIWVYRQYGRDNIGWVLRDSLAFVRECVGIILFERDRRAKMRAVIRGIYHGLVGRLGPVQQ